MRVPIIRKQLVRRPAMRAASLRHSRGQSLPEFALVLPFFLFVILIGLDFGRVYSGWVTLQQAARIAANYAAVNPDAWNTPGSILRRQEYQDLIASETDKINCAMPSPAPDPIFSPGKLVGDSASVTLTCDFSILTPIIAAVLPNPLPASASSTFAIRTGFTNNSTCVQTGTCPAAPIAAFATLPAQAVGTTTTTITSGQSVQFNNSTQGNATAWVWDFGDGSATSSDTSPPLHAYTNPGSSDISFTVTLQACNLGGCSTATGTIIVHSATPAPAAAFCWRTGPAPCPTPSATSFIGPITVTFDDESTGTPTSWLWTFSDGGTSTQQSNVQHVYAAVAVATVRTITLQVTNAIGSSQVQHQITINPPAALCTVPTFTGNDPLNTQHGKDAGKWTTTDVFEVWTHTAAQYNALQSPPTNYSWTGGGFSSTSIFYSTGQPGAAQLFTVGGQNPAAGTPNILCTTSLTITSWSP
jgi:PKD repeat protein